MQAPAGWYGKLPILGDFTRRHLPPAFIDPWDDWLQAGIAGSRAALGGAWLDHYLTAHVWHFVLMPGVLGPPAWAGVCRPSVDRVGRYFPFTLAAPLAPGSTPTARVSTCRSRSSRSTGASRSACRPRAPGQRSHSQLGAGSARPSHWGGRVRRHPFQTHHSSKENHHDQPIHHAFGRGVRSPLPAACQSPQSSRPVERPRWGWLPDGSFR